MKKKTILHAINLLLFNSLFISGHCQSAKEAAMIANRLRNERVNKKFKSKS